MLPLGTRRGRVLSSKSGNYIPPFGYFCESILIWVLLCSGTGITCRMAFYFLSWELTDLVLVNGNSHTFNGNGPFYWVNVLAFPVQTNTKLGFSSGWSRWQWWSHEASTDDEVRANVLFSLANWAWYFVIELRFLAPSKWASYLYQNCDRYSYILLPECQSSQFTCEDVQRV